MKGVRLLFPYSHLNFFIECPLATTNCENTLGVVCLHDKGTLPMALAECSTGESQQS